MQAWVVGQAVSARASLQLLDALARKAANHPGHTPWPEFAEYGCASCHHDLNPQRPHDPHSVHKAGSPSWSPFVDLTRLMPAHPPLTNIEELRKTMESQHPDLHKVTQLSKSVIQEYDEWLKQSRPRIDYSPAALRERLKLLAGPKGQAVAAGGWEDARQLTNALSAYYRSLNAVEPDAELGNAVQGLMNQLRLPSHYDTPPRYDSAAIVKALRDIDDRLKSR